MAATRGMGRAPHLGRSRGTWLKLQQGRGREKVRSSCETSSTAASPQTHFPSRIVRSVTELGNVEALKYKHPKTTLWLRALGSAFITSHHALCAMPEHPFFKLINRINFNGPTPGLPFYEA